MSITIYHNPKCNKSRTALKYLQDEELAFEIVTYLDGNLTETDLVAILASLGLTAKDVMRKGEVIYKQLKLDDIDDDAKLLDAIIKNPILLERPILVKDGKAAIGRPIKNIYNLLGK